MSALRSRRRRVHRRSMLRARRGMSLVELMVAILVLSIGLLALAGVGARVGRQVNTAGLDTNASLIVQARIDSLSSIPCDNLTALQGAPRSSTPISGVTETWTVTDGYNVKNISVTLTLRGRVNPMVYNTVIPCRET